MADTGLDIQIRYHQRVALNELATRFDMIAHEGSEYLIGAYGVVDLDLHEAPGIRIHGGLPELVRIHLTKALVALHMLATLGLREKPFISLLERFYRL